MHPLARWLIAGAFTCALAPLAWAQARLNREIGRIMQTAETRTLLASMAAEAVPPMTPEAFAAHQQKARDRFGAVVREANIRVN